MKNMKLTAKNPYFSSDGR